MDLLINNQKYTVGAKGDESLLTVLRNDLDLTGTKYGCGEAQCGACKVLIDGVATPSCITPLSAVEGKKITTIEGIATNNKLHAVQQAFLKEDVFQCAYCAPGMVIAAVSLLKKNNTPSQAEIIQGMEGNVCRCGTYPRIVRAIQEASKSLGNAGQSN
jgi:aerobic-type carbon monoxide dehydrogenase small subunit (CoxS/CutS family)